MYTDDAHLQLGCFPWTEWRRVLVLPEKTEQKGPEWAHWACSRDTQVPGPGVHLWQSFLPHTLQV